MSFTECKVRTASIFKEQTAAQLSVSVFLGLVELFPLQGSKYYQQLHNYY